MTSSSRLLRIVSTDFLALRLFCFNVRQHCRQILYFQQLHVDGHRLCTVDLYSWPWWVYNRNRCGLSQLFHKPLRRLRVNVEAFSSANCSKRIHLRNVPGYVVSWLFIIAVASSAGDVHVRDVTGNRWHNCRGDCDTVCHPDQTWTASLGTKAVHRHAVLYHGPDADIDL